MARNIYSRQASTKLTGLKRADLFVNASNICSLIIIENRQVYCARDMIILEF